MQLTSDIKKQIDAMSYEAMLAKWRLSPPDSPMFQGESADYFIKRMKELREQPGGKERHVAASKAIGW